MKAYLFKISTRSVVSVITYSVFVILVVSTLVACGGGSSPADSAMPVMPPSGPVSELGGSPTARVTATVTDLFVAKPVPDSATETDASGVTIVRSELEIGLTTTATVADANRTLASIDGKIVAMAKGVPQLLVRFPDPGSLGALDTLIATLVSDPAVAYVSRGILPKVSGLPANVSPDQRSEMERIRHALAVRAAGAWQAEPVLGVASNPPLMILLDHFGAGPPVADFDVLMDTQNYSRADPSAHGYHVLGVMAARFGGGNDERGRITGFYPHTLDVLVVDMAIGSSMNMLEWSLFDRIRNTANRHVIVNTSISYPCNDAASVAAYCSEAYAREHAITWIDKVRGRGLENRFLHVSAAGNVDVAGDIDARLSSTFAAARLITDLRRGDGTAVPPLQNTLVVENVAANDDAPPFRPVCLASYSKRNGDLAAIGTDVWSLAGPGAGDGVVSMNGASQATPAVAATAAYVWALDSSLSVAQVKSVILGASRRITVDWQANSASCDALSSPGPVLDAYAAVLAVDRADAIVGSGRISEAPVRMAILDVADAVGIPGSNGRFDEYDLRLWLQQLDTTSPPPDYTRFDLNGDAYTGGDHVERLDLDIDGVFSSGVAQDIEGDSIDFDETALSDMQVLCYYAYSPLYAGDVDERTRLMTPYLGQCGGKAWGTPEVIVAAGTGSLDLAMDEGGNAVIVWENFGIWSRQYLAGSGWQAAANIGGDGFGSRIATSAVGSVAVWRARVDRDRIIQASHQVAGQAWQTALAINPADKTSNGYPRIGMDAFGNAMAVWEYNGTDIYFNRYLAGGGWSGAQILSGVNDDVYAPDVAVSGNGHVVATWGQYVDSDEYVYAGHFTAGSGWVGRQAISTGSPGRVSNPRVAVSASGNAVVVWKVNESPGKSVYASYYTAGSGWGRAQPLSLSKESLGDLSVAIDDAGNAMAIWKQISSAGGSYDVWVNHYAVDSGWEGAQTIETSASRADAPRVAMQGASGKAIAVWQQEGHVLANHYSPGNGWQEPQTIDTDAGIGGSPQIVMDSDGNAMVAWYYSGDGNIYANRYE